MRWVNEERGAAAVLTAVSMTAIIAMAAFAVDAGALYSERRELQNGADAAALAIAEDCADESLPCFDATALATGDAYADANASDSAALIHDIALDPTARTVTVTVRSEDEAGETVLAPYFAQIIGFNGTEVQAAATAEWGYPLSLKTFPLIISDCEWNDPSNPLQEGPPFGGSPAVFYIHDGGSEATCPHGPSGWDLPGGFGWLSADDGPCQAFVKKGLWVPTDPGASPSNGCTAKLIKDAIFHKVVMLPYYEDLTGTGNSIEYKVAGLGAFYVTGYYFGGQFKEPSGGPYPCSGDERCISGYHTYETIYDGELGGEDRGVTLVKLTN